MASLRSTSRPGDSRQDELHALAPGDEDWLTLSEAACEMGVSVATARRLLRKGKLPNRIVPRRGGFAYLIYMPGNRHRAGGLCSTNGHAPARSNGNGAHGIDQAEYEREVARLQEQVDALSNALSRALRIKQKSLPPGLGAPQNPEDPFERYRWLVRKRRWWPFS
jgi:hypothetical protein